MPTVSIWESPGFELDTITEGMCLHPTKFVNLCSLFPTLETGAGKPGMNGFNDSGSRLDLGNSPKMWNWIIRAKVRCGSLGHEGAKFQWRTNPPQLIKEFHMFFV